MVLPRKVPMNAKVMKQVMQTMAPADGQKFLMNRNPRNLEFLRIAHKPEGYYLDKPGRLFWNKLNLTSSGKYVTAQLEHHQRGTVIEASTSEWAIKKQLFKTSDYSAYYNLARVFAQRCLESGFLEMRCDLEAAEGTKTEAFLKVLQDNGILLKEPPSIKPQLEVNHYRGRKEKPYGDWEEH